jgi:hypothetical protein
LGLCPRKRSHGHHFSVCISFLLLYDEDLLIFYHRSDRRSGPPRLQFHQFSTGSKHPSAANYCLEFNHISIARATCIECCGDNMVAVILDGEEMRGGNGDYIFLVEWKIGRITLASLLMIQPHHCCTLTCRSASNSQARNVWCFGHLSIP